jgi:hypothetical protein
VGSDDNDKADVKCDDDDDDDDGASTDSEKTDLTGLFPSRWKKQRIKKRMLAFERGSWYANP